MYMRAPNDLERCLSALDLTAIGLSSTLGSNLYMISAVAAVIAGPAVILSLMIAAIASFFNAVCYAQLAAKVPRAGSVYDCSYMMVSASDGSERIKTTHHQLDH